MRAFLSHKSEDKPLVGSVAKELGRQFCVWDEWEFQTGEDFREAIRRGLSEASVFVLFASKKALESIWVSFEIDEAELRKIRGNLKKILVFIVDSAIEHKDLPEWLQRGKVEKQNSPKIIARDIHYHLQDIIREQQQPVFVNRLREIEEAQSLLLPTDGRKPPRVFLFAGLSGIGRRTFCSRISRDILRLPSK